MCRENQRQKCSRSDAECKFAHPPANVEVQNGRVTACYDSIKVGVLAELILYSIYSPYFQDISTITFKYLSPSMPAAKCFYNRFVQFN